MKIVRFICLYYEWKEFAALYIRTSETYLQIKANYYYYYYTIEIMQNFIFMHITRKRRKINSKQTHLLGIKKINITVVV